MKNIEKFVLTFSATETIVKSNYKQLQTERQRTHLSAYTKNVINTIA